MTQGKQFDRLSSAMIPEIAKGQGASAQPVPGDDVLPELRSRPIAAEVTQPSDAERIRGIISRLEPMAGQVDFSAPEMLRSMTAAIIAALKAEGMSPSPDRVRQVREALKASRVDTQAAPTPAPAVDPAAAPAASTTDGTIPPNLDRRAAPGQKSTPVYTIPPIPAAMTPPESAANSQATDTSASPVPAVSYGEEIYSVWGAHGDGPLLDRDKIEGARDQLIPLVLDRVDPAKLARLSERALHEQLRRLIAELASEARLELNGVEQARMVELITHEMVGLGPLEPLLADEQVNDIMVNGTHSTYVEVRGKLKRTDVRFRNNAHILAIAKRIVAQIGRRIDETRPLVDARLKDGSRVNVIIPPLAIDGPAISIRKFSKKKITLDVMSKNGTLSMAMATVLEVASRSRTNVLISGGTGSGKTTLLNALSQVIDHGERIITIEDAAELQLQQPHVVRLETRPPNLEGEGEITQRELVKNALRMRPDRIILGEVRGEEALDMLQAMNTGHDGSLATLHANRPREALTRLENMVGMGASTLPAKAIRQQIAASINLIIQIARMRDGARRVTYISEIVGMEGDVISIQDLFVFEQTGEDKDGRLTGVFKPTGIRPKFLARARNFGLDKKLMAVL